MEIEYVEIHNDVIYDLLDSSTHQYDSNHTYTNSYHSRTNSHHFNTVYTSK